jgi:hypothetical protein
LEADKSLTLTRQKTASTPLTTGQKMEMNCKTAIGGKLIGVAMLAIGNVKAKGKRLKAEG